MKLPVIQGVIRRRILVNFRVSPDVIQRQLPPPFRPKLLADSGVAGICLIRIEQLRPKFVPSPLGLVSENAAHRIAVTWADASGREREGVYIPRRDSDSVVNHLVGGRLFPGEHERATFEIQDEGDKIDFSMRSADGGVTLQLRAHLATTLPPTSAFGSLKEASTFFEKGSLGFSARKSGEGLDALRLHTYRWHVQPLSVDHVYSSYFGDERRFPSGSVAFDCALLMRDIPHEWLTATSPTADMVAASA